MTDGQTTKKPFYLALHNQILFALLAGVLVGAFFGKSVAWIGVFGDIFVGFLKMVVMPLIFCSIVVAITGLGGGKLGKLGAKTLGFYFLTTALAVVVGLGLANTIRPGEGASIAKKHVVTAYQFDFNGNRKFDPPPKGQKAQEGVFLDRTQTVDKTRTRMEIPAAIAKGPKRSLTYWVIYSDFDQKTGEGREEHSVEVGGAGARTKAGLEVKYEEDAGIAYLEPELPPDPEVKIKTGSLMETFMKAIPTNPLGSMAKGEILPTVVFAVILALALLQMGTKSKVVIEVLSVISDAMVVIVNTLLKVTPFGVFALITATIAASGIGILQSLLWYCIAVVTGLAIQSFVVYPVLIRIFGGKSPIEFFAGMKDAILFAFSTSSSSATLPVTMKCLEKNLGVPKKVTNFVLPLGATVNMDGTALYEAMAAIFIAQAYGIDLSIGQQITIFVTANLAAMGAAGIPGAGLVTMAMVLNAVGLPLEGLGMILAVDRILDMFRTATNVTGDGAVALIVGRGMAPDEEETAAETAGDAEVPDVAPAAG